MARNKNPKPFFSTTPCCNFLILLVKKWWLAQPLFLLLGILFLTFPLSAANIRLRHVYLTWQHNPTRSVTVNVHGIKTPNELTLYYDIESHAGDLSAYRQSVTCRGKPLPYLLDGRVIYHFEATALEPGRRYYFVVGDKNSVFGEEYSFRTLPQGEEPLFFVEGGDWENTSEAAALASKAASLNPMAVLLGGDYPSGVFSKKDYKKWDIWLDVYAAHMITKEGCLIPMVMAIGNHEVVGGYAQPKSQAPFFFEYFKQGEGEKSYFSLPLGDRGTLFVLDSGHIADHGGEQKEWLETALKEHRHSPLKIAIYHVPLYPSIRFFEKSRMYRLVYKLIERYKGKALAEKLYSRESSLGRKHWLPLFDAYSLTVAFEHHDQALKRTYLLRNGQHDPHGTLYLGDGGWGPARQYPVIQRFFHRHFAAMQGKQQFFWAVRIEKEAIDYSAITSSGKVLDHFVQKIGELKKND